MYPSSAKNITNKVKGMKRDENICTLVSTAHLSGEVTDVLICNI